MAGIHARFRYFTRLSSHGFSPLPVPLVDISRRCPLSVCIHLPRVDGDTLKTSTFFVRDLSNGTLTNNRLGTMPRSLESRRQRHETTAFKYATGPSRRAYDESRSFDAITQSLTTLRVGNLFIVYTKGEASGVFPITSSNYYHISVPMSCCTKCHRLRTMQIHFHNAPSWLSDDAPRYRSKSQPR